MPVEVNLNSYKQVLESSDGNASVTIADGGTAQYILPSTAGAEGQVLKASSTPATLEWGTSDAVGIQSTVDNNDGTFTLNYTDNTSFTTSDLTGPAGPEGSPAYAYANKFTAQLMNSYSDVVWNGAQDSVATNSSDITFDGTSGFTLQPGSSYHFSGSLSPTNFGDADNTANFTFVDASNTVISGSPYLTLQPVNKGFPMNKTTSFDWIYTVPAGSAVVVKLRLVFKIGTNSSVTLSDSSSSTLTITKVTSGPTGPQGPAGTMPSKKLQTLETVMGLCDGRSVVADSGTYTIPNVTAVQAISGTTYVDVNGTTIDYLPPSGTTQVEYVFTFNLSKENDYTVIHTRFMLGGAEVTAYKRTWGVSVSIYGLQVDFRAVIQIDSSLPSDDVANGKLKSWSAAKELKLMARGYDSKRMDLFDLLYVDGASANGTLTRPTLKIVAVGTT